MRIFNYTNADFQNQLAVFIAQERVSEIDVSATVKEIIDDIRLNGDQALIERIKLYEDPKVRLENLRITKQQIQSAYHAIDNQTLKALEFAADRIRSFHARAIPTNEFYEDETGTELGWRYTPIDAVGVYVPGGRAAYPSSALMNVIPAVIAQVPRIVAVTPAMRGEVNPVILAALDLAGATEIYRFGGAHAVAALAYGTESFDPVYKITGPGNAYVAEAKRQVFGKVGIDSVAGPSEILILSDNQSDPDWIALDLLAQAEHDVVAQSVLITDDADFADRVLSAVRARLKTLARPDTAKESLDKNGAIIIVPDWETGCEIANRFAPEHLEICTDIPETLAANIRNAGAIFLGRHTPEAIGDYLAGPNHVLPTGRGARFSSGLGVSDFVKRTTLIKCSPESLKKIGDHAVILAAAENLEAHKLSVLQRITDKK